MADGDAQPVTQHGRDTKKRGCVGVGTVCVWGGGCSEDEWRMGSAEVPRAFRRKVRVCVCGRVGPQVYAPMDRKARAFVFVPAFAFVPVGRELV